MSSVWVPISTMRPDSRTAMRSADRTVDSRWAITSEVRPFISRSSATWMAFSLAASKRTRGLVEDEQVGIAQEGPGQCDALSLSAGELHPPLAYQGVEALGKALDEVQCQGVFGGFLDFGFGCVRACHNGCSLRLCRQKG